MYGYVLYFLNEQSENDIFKQFKNSLERNMWSGRTDNQQSTCRPGGVSASISWYSESFP